MGVGLNSVFRLFDESYVPSTNARVLDIGCSNIHSVQAEALIGFIKARNDIYDDADLSDWAGYVEAGGAMDPVLGGLNGAWLGDVLVRAGMTYEALDIFPGYQTRIFDLNRESLPPGMFGAYDVVLNYGTTEHVFNQYNAFQVLHDAMAVGGVVCHELPMTGHMNHGFFNYNPVCLVSLAAANGYEILDMSFSGERGGDRIDQRLVSLYQHQPYFRMPSDQDGWTSAVVPTGSVRLVARKVRDAPFRIALETSTTVGTVADEIGRSYQATAARDGGGGARALQAWTRSILLRIHNPDLTTEELNAFYQQYVASGDQEPFPLSIELRMIDDALARAPGHAQLTERRGVVMDLFRGRYPLLKALDSLDAAASAATTLDGEEAGFDLSGPKKTLYRRLSAAYRAYWRNAAVELFPPRLEAAALKLRLAEAPNDSDALLRFGRVVSEITTSKTLRLRT